MFKFIKIKLNERAVIFKDGLPVRALGPGRHLLWGARLTEQRWNTDEIVFKALPEVRKALPADWFAEVKLGTRERAVIFRDGKPEKFLRPGTHRYWTVDPTLELAAHSVDGAMPELTNELAAVIPKNEYVEIVVTEHEQGLFYAQGKLQRTLTPGRYTTWTYPEAQIHVAKVDMRTFTAQIAGQELMTRDKVTLRLNLTVEFAVEDAARATHSVSNVEDAVYLAVQLAARDYVAGVTLDQLLEGRDDMTRFLEAQVAPKAKAFGVRVDRVGVKDVVLPGDMKTLLNRVIEAEKEAAANVILRREETAATRSLANTARVMAEHPILLRLKELEAMKDIAERHRRGARRGRRRRHEGAPAGGTSGSGKELAPRNGGRVQTDADRRFPFFRETGWTFRAAAPISTAYTEVRPCRSTTTLLWGTRGFGFPLSV
jgi:regulator of protease activity HflC (stomatin/prohibitin superfamily)